MQQDKQMNSTRRKLLQSAVGGAALATTGMASLALAASNVPSPEKTPDMIMGSALPSCDLTIYQLQSGTRELVTVMNQTGESVTIDEVYPVGLSQPNGSLVVKVSVPNGPITLTPGQRLTFSIEATTGNTQWGLNDQVLPNIVAGRVKAIPNVIAGKIRVRSQHPAFNGVIPVTAFDAVPV